jgi:hypothetical protein
MTDESWRWEFSEPAQGEARVYSRLYENMLRWLTGDPAMRRMAMETRAETVPGAGARINGRILGPDYSPLPGAKVGLVLRRDDAAPVRLEAETGPDGFYSAPVQALPPGVYEAEAVAAAGGAEPGTLRQAVLVDTGDPELMGAAPDAALMGAVAAVSGGRLSYTADAPLEKLAFPDRSQEVVSRKEHGTLWDRMWIILAISIVLASEWALRRRWGQQ